MTPINLEDKVTHLLSVSRKLMNTQLHSLKMLALLNDELDHLDKAFAESRIVSVGNQFFQRTQTASTSNPIETSQARRLHSIPDSKLMFDLMIQSKPFKPEVSQLPALTIQETPITNTSPKLIQDQTSLLYLSHKYQSDNPLAPNPGLSAPLPPESEINLQALIHKEALPSTSQSSAPIVKEETNSDRYDLASSLLYLSNQYRTRADVHEPMEPEERVYCICQQSLSENMIACMGKCCRIKLFHLACVNLHDIPQLPWFCPDCSNV
ncbi:uncharacterized protein LOC143920868 [Arctopsyche grandis]|uniref:uncharacterized protein LOC143920868 n=1 Tax=Arctopsyche grandis TaxID=121162 RepID=UPI00406D67D1